MGTFLLSFLLIALAVLGMAVGVLFGRNAIKGSCGGLNNLEGLEADCPICSGQCENRSERWNENTTGKGETSKKGLTKT